MKRTRLIPLALCLAACGGARKQQPGDTLENEEGGDSGKITLVDYEKKTKELMDATQQLGGLQNQLDEQRRRLTLICLDYPDHEVCQPQTRVSYARDAFCSDKDFTQHIDEVVNACHQGECKQVDDASQISRSDYMLLTQRLPHQLVTFHASQTALDTDDRKDMQHFLETIEGEKGYVIIVGRASRDGDWRQNLRLALDRAENTRKYLVDQLGVDASRVGYITYGNEKMYLTELDAQRLSQKKLSETQANRSALIFSYPCFDAKRAAEAKARAAEPAPVAAPAAPAH
jgi:outer membrane protein OmpA-like peptidoglycan-associated protein